MAIASGNGGSFWDHLEEFRKRLFLILAAVAVMSAVAFIFSRPITDHVTGTSPVALVALAPAEAVTVHLKLAVTAGIIASVPVILFQAWRFIAPGLYAGERKAIVWVTSAGSVLFLAGTAFAWFVMRPPALVLFQSFETGNITGLWSVSSYIEFIGTFLFVFGAAFQLPLAVLFLVRTGIISPKDLSAYRRHIVVGLLVIAAILTPPDILTQIMLALPLYVLFELSLLVARIAFRRTERNRR